MKRVLTLLISTIIALNAMPLASFAYTYGAFDNRAAELESKFGILIEYSASSFSESNLDTLDMALSNLTPAAVRQVSEYYRAKNGNPITVSYITESRLNGNRLDLASFDTSTSVITVYLSNNSEAGDNPISLVHEFGHAIHEMFLDSYGYDEMLAEWNAFNHGYGYSGGIIEQNPNENVFISAYAATGFREDVAEVIGHAFIRYRAGQGFTGKLSANGMTTGLGAKLSYVEWMLDYCIDDSDAMIANFRRTYSAPTAYKYQAIRFSGSYMQYSGYPQPALVLDSILADMGIRRSKAAWIRDMGAWYVRTTDSVHLIIFPGGAWYSPRGSFTPPI